MWGRGLIAELHRHSSGGRDSDRDDVIAGRIRDTDEDLIMHAVAVDAAEEHVAEDGLREEGSRKDGSEVGFAEVAREESPRTVEDSQVNDVVVIDIFNFDTFVVEGRLHHFVRRWVHLHVAVIAILSPCHNSVSSKKSVLVEGPGRRVLKLESIVRVFAQGERHRFAILIFEDEEVWGLLHDRIFYDADSVHGQSIFHDLEIYGTARRVGIEDGVAAHFESYALIIRVDPNALQQLLSHPIFFLQLGRFPSSTVAGCEDDDQTEKPYLAFAYCHSYCCQLSIAHSHVRPML